MHDLTSAVICIGNALPVAGVALTAYDPQFDPDGKVVDVGREILEALLSCTHL